MDPTKCICTSIPTLKGWPIKQTIFLPCWDPTHPLDRGACYRAVGKREDSVCPHLGVLNKWKQSKFSLPGRRRFQKAPVPRQSPGTGVRGRKTPRGTGAHPARASRPRPSPRRALHGDVTGAADHHRVGRVLQQLLLQGPLLVLLLLVDLIEIRHPAPASPPPGALALERPRGTAGEAAGAEATELALGRVGSGY